MHIQQPYTVYRFVTSGFQAFDNSFKTINNTAEPVSIYRSKAKYHGTETFVAFWYQAR